MQLTQTQIDAFERDGYLFFPALFRPDEVKVLLDEVPALYAQRRPEREQSVKVTEATLTYVAVDNERRPRVVSDLQPSK